MPRPILPLLLALLAGSFNCTPHRAPLAPSVMAELPGRLVFVRDNRLILLTPSNHAVEFVLAEGVSPDRPIEVSPDGGHILFSRIAPGVEDLWILDLPAAGKAPAPPRNLTRRAAGAARSPAWSPDSTRIAFMSDQPVGLHVINPDGTGLRRLTHDGQLEQSPVWTPDGQSIVYGELVFTDESAVDKFRMELFAADLKDLSPAAPFAPTRKLATGNGPSDSPAMSASAPKLAYRGRRAGREQILTLDPAAPAESRLTRATTGEEHDPRWSPDGKRIAFWRRIGDQEILLTARDGTDLEIPACELPAATRPGPVDWSPDGSCLAWVNAGRELHIVSRESCERTPFRVSQRLAPAAGVRWLK